MGLVDEKHLNPQFLPADRRFGIASLLARRVEQLRLQPPDRALDLLHAPARDVILVSVFEFFEVGAKLRQLAFDEAGGGRLAHWKQGKTGMRNEDQVPVPGRDARHQFATLGAAEFGLPRRKYPEFRIDSQGLPLPLHDEEMIGNGGECFASKPESLKFIGSNDRERSLAGTDV